MIIKSMSRKQATFSQLVDYFEDGRQDEKYSIFHNLYSTNAEAIKEEFITNANFLHKRKNGVYMYHEILSITDTGNLSREQQKEILKDIGLEYIRTRANKNLVYAVLHDDKADNLHYHFMISSNELMSETRLRLSKEQFSQIKKDLELKVLKEYPELEQKKLINKEKGANKDSGEKLSNKGVELKRRTGKTSQRDDLKDRLKTVFAGSKNKAEFFSLLEKENLSIYVHGNTIGILDKATDRKHRLKTLGMLDEFNVISQIIESSEAKKQPENQKPEQEPTQEKINSNTVNKDFSKEKINTGFYHQQQEKPIEKPSEPKPEKSQPIPETAEEIKPAKDFSKEKINTGFYHRQQQEKTSESKSETSEAKPKPAEEKKPFKASESNAYGDNRGRRNSDENDKKQDRQHSRYNPDRNEKPTEDKKPQPSRDEYRYRPRKDETDKSYKPKNEADVKPTKRDDKGKDQEQHKPREQHKTDHYQSTDNKRNKPERDYRKTHFQQEKAKANEPNKPKTDVELEIECRKKQMQKERENEADYSNDYFKGR